jgi:hypothetical protein
MKRDYKMLRELLDPEAACTNLARSYDCAVDLARLLISTVDEVRICASCWREYRHTRNDNRLLCDDCMAEERLLYNTYYYEESLRRRLFPPKFLDHEETVSQTIIMLTSDYGMTSDEALRYISDVQDTNQICVKEEVFE